MWLCVCTYLYYELLMNNVSIFTILDCRITFTKPKASNGTKKAA